MQSPRELQELDGAQGIHCAQRVSLIPFERRKSMFEKSHKNIHFLVNLAFCKSEEEELGKEGGTEGREGKRKERKFLLYQFPYSLLLLCYLI